MGLVSYSGLFSRKSAVSIRQIKVITPVGIGIAPPIGSAAVPQSMRRCRSKNLKDLDHLHSQWHRELRKRSATGGQASTQSVT